MPNILDPDQAQHFVGPDQGPKCLQRSIADDTMRCRQSKSYFTLTLLNMVVMTVIINIFQFLLYMYVM